MSCQTMKSCKYPRRNKAKLTSSNVIHRKAQWIEEQCSSSHRKAESNSSDHKSSSEESWSCTREFACFFVELGDAGGIELLTSGDVDEVSEVG